MQKSIFLSAPFFLLFALVLLLFSSCKENTTTNIPKPPAEISNFVYAYTSGVVSKTTPIRVRFTSEAVAVEEVGKTVETNLYSMQPKVEGKAIWEDTRTILFQPETYLDAGTAYNFSVSLGELFDDVPNNINIYEMPFRTRALRYNVNVDGLRAESLSLIHI